MDRVDGYNGIYKDSETGVIVNRGSSDRERYKLAKEHAMKNMESREEIKDLKKELDEIKSLLKQIIKWNTL